MKLVFTKLETPASEIKIAFDGINYKSYNVDEIKSTGYIQFTEEDCPDLTKVKIQGKSLTLSSIEVNKSVELERDDSAYMNTILDELSIIDENGVFEFKGHVTIPDCATAIDDNAFNDCENLTGITIPDSVTSIGYQAFSSCDGLTDVVIPDSVTEIGLGAFMACDNLTSIVIPKGVTELKHSVFRYCENLRTINYKGTEEQWDAILKSDGWNAYVPSDCVVNYNYKSE